MEPQRMSYTYYLTTMDIRFKHIQKTSQHFTMDSTTPFLNRNWRFVVTKQKKSICMQVGRQTGSKGRL